MSFRSVLLTALLSLSFTTTMQAAHHHYHRYTDKLHRQNHKKDLISPKPTEQEACNTSSLSKELIPLSEQRGLLSPICDFISERPCLHGVSVRNLKQALKNSAGTQIALDWSILPQWFNPRVSHAPKLSIRDFGYSAHQTVTEATPPCWQNCFNPSAAVTIYDSSYGKGVFQISYTLVRYWRENAATAGDAMMLAGSINDYPSRQNIFSQFTFSQNFPNERVSLTIGQYSLYAIDGTLYNNDQQLGFISYALSQNPTATYSSGSLGAYLQVAPTASTSLQIGFQDAYNISGSSIKWSNLTKNRYNFHGFASWAPRCCLGSGQYSVLLYVTRQVPEQMEQTMGWSVNASQYISSKLYVFGRYSGVTGHVFPINRTYSFGMASANLFNRNPQDLFGIACAFNNVHLSASPNTKRKYETVIEGFATIGCGPYLSFAPDFQLYLYPALRPNKQSARVYSVRANLAI
ncbi:Carbohydrate-selective porin [Chlamydia trachomatis D/SotonD1]|nr:porin AaxA [Chlamydia trachomatis]CCP52559.1 Carbohydrate-selective porin [Chlamydia trachomatis D/SotonD1]CCP57049.1 Carbohydrate-selective porin [Chlamydia trachomatis F/SotonF3]ROT59951.1 porin AaxA [Chlamydia trachomatis]CPR45516.1 carbohydrate-selective porin%2C OprB family protein [Chlamydia trachomatis]